MSPRVLVLAGGAPWESAVLAALDEASVVVLRRCVDVVDLMAAGSIGQADVAVIAADLPRLDAETVQHLRRYDVAVVAVGDAASADRMQRLGVAATTPPDAIVAAVLGAVRDPAEALYPEDEVAPEPDGDGRPQGRIVVVWGPVGAPGRTTVAITLAAEVAAAGQRSVLVDADPYGGSVVQHLGMLEEVSGVLAAARRANAGALDTATLTASCRRVGERLDVLTGIPRADRRIEVRPGVLGEILALAAQLGDVVVDTGPCAEDAERDRMTMEALEEADEIVVVGSADPVGLSRLARAVVDLKERLPGTPTRIVLNRMRPGLRWSAAEVSAMIEGYAGPVAVHVVPEDRDRLDQALVTGRTLVELGESPVRTALAAVAQAAFPGAFSGESSGTSPAGARVRRRKAGRARSRYRRPSPRGDRAGR